MTIFFAVLPAAAFLVAVVAAIIFAVLAFRNPFRPMWMRRDWAAIAAALLTATTISIAVGVMITTAADAGLGIRSALGLTILTGAGAAYVLLRLFGVAERLRRADAGQSPFASGKGAAGPPRLWRFGGGAGA